MTSDPINPSSGSTDLWPRDPDDTRSPRWGRGRWRSFLLNIFSRKGWNHWTPVNTVFLLYVCVCYCVCSCVCVCYCVCVCVCVCVLGIYEAFIVRLRRFQFFRFLHSAAAVRLNPNLNQTWTKPEPNLNQTWTKPESGVRPTWHQKTTI